MQLREVFTVELLEKWSNKYKKSINCSNPKGFSQRAHCAGRKKTNESSEVILWTNPKYKGVDLDYNYWKNKTSKKISISKLKPNEPEQKMKSVGGAKQKSKFIDKFKSGQKVDPVFVVKRKNGDYLVVDGNHRYFAAKDAGMDAIEVIQIPNKDVKVRKDVPPKDQQKQHQYENFADGKVKGKSRPGRVKRAGASCKGSVTSLRSKAKKASGERAKMYHWCANMKSGRNK